MKNIELVLQELVDVNLSPLEAQQVQHIIQHAFMAGKAEQADHLAGYSNLTAAIEAGEPIDWEKLDGKRVQCVNPDIGMLSGRLERDLDYLPDICGAWWGMDMDDAYISALIDAWRGEDGWSLYIEGAIPLRRKTADQLEVGTYFLGETREKKLAEMYMGEIFD